MANNVWSSAGSTDGNVAGNWSLGWVPKAGDIAYFDNTSVVNCTFSAPITCDGLAIAAGYTGIVDNDTQTMVIDTDGVDVDVGTLNLGAGKWTVQGNWLIEAAATVTRNAASEVELAGAGKTVGAGYDKRFQKLTVSGTYTTAGAVYASGALVITGSFTVDHPASAFSTVALNGTKLDGSSTVIIGGNITRTAGTWSVAETICGNGNRTLDPGTYTTDLTFKKSWSAGKVTKVLSAGTYTIQGNLTIDSDGTAQEFEIDFATNNPDFNVSGDVTLTESVGTVSITPGSGDFTFNGAGAQTYSDATAAGPQGLGNVVHDGAGSFQLLTGLDCTTFNTGAQGTFDPNGQTIDCSGNVDWDDGWDFIGDADALNGCTWLVGGNFTAENQTCKATAGWTLTVTGTAVASGTGAVAHSNAGDGTEIDASAEPWTDNGNNTNWSFGAVGVAPTSHLYGSLVGPLGGAV